MLARIRRSLEPSSQNSEGFTLIELLVVMVIIGILAAIAIPSFLAQRDKGYQSAEKSDLKTVSIAEQSYATDNNGAYTGDAGILSTTATTDVLVAQGAKVSGNDTVKAVLFTTSVANDSYCLTATSTKSTAIWYLSSVDDTPVKAKPNAACL
jgi:type IV pilus assembly protein PilA